MKDTDKKKPFFRELTSEELAEFGQIEREWGKFLRSAPRPAEKKTRGIEHMMMEAVDQFLKGRAGRRVVSEKMEAIRESGLLREYGISAVEGCFISLGALLKDAPAEYQLVMPSGESSVKVGRIIGADDLGEIDLTQTPGADMAKLLATAAEMARFDEILNGGRPVVGNLLPVMVEFDGRILKIVVLEILSGEQVADENPMAAYALYAGLQNMVGENISNRR